MIFFLFSIIVSAFGAFNCQAIPKNFSVKIHQIHPHDTVRFTQGLAIEGNVLYESCGLYGESCLIKTDISSQKILNMTYLPAKYFAEGIAFIDNQVIQLTWKEHTAFVYDKNTLAVTGQFAYLGEGWGLCKDKDSLWMSDGSAQLVKRNSKDFTIEKSLIVLLNGYPQKFLNDLESVGSYLYANVLGSDKILQIEKATGFVAGIIDTSHLLTKKEKSQLKFSSVLNGIAYREETHTFFLTGKCWPFIFEVIFEEKSV